ncbi:MAG: hypothetical protein R3C01_14635 [Planctomycetaceae bacterium]
MAVADVGDAAAQVLERLPFDEPRVLVANFGAAWFVKGLLRGGADGVWAVKVLRGEGGGLCGHFAVDGAAAAESREDGSTRCQEAGPLLRSGDLVTIWIPDAATEAIRDLVRAG